MKRLKLLLFVLLLILATLCGCSGDNSSNNNQSPLSNMSGKSVGLAITTTKISDMKTNVPVSIKLTHDGIGTGPFTWSVTNGALPTGLALNVSEGSISGTPTLAGDYTFEIAVTDSALITAKQPYSVSVGLAITTTQISDMKTNIPVSITLTHNGVGTGPFIWSVSKGALPTGSGPTANPAPGTGTTTLALDQNGGTISGIPTLAGDYTFEITVTDSASTTATLLYSVSVRDPINITNTSLKNWSSNQAGYVDTLTATGGRGIYTWSLASGSLPPGLALNSSTGVISGTPSTADTYTFSVQVADSAPVLEAISKQFTIVITTGLTISTTQINSATADAPYSFTMESSGGTPPKTWTSTALPGGLSLNTNTGILSGNPFQSGTVLSIFTVMDSIGTTSTKTLSITVAPALQILTSTLKPWTVGVGGYSDFLLASGGHGPYTWEWGNDGDCIGSSTIPTGLVLTPTTGQITGTPITAHPSGTSFCFKTTDSNGATKVGAINGFKINPQMSFVTTSLSPATPSIPYQGTLSMTGGTAPYTWSILSGSIPAGLVFDLATGNISGTPTTAGTSTFTVQITDATKATKTQVLSITVAETLTISTASPLSQATLQADYNTTLTATGGRAPYIWSVTTGALPTGLKLASATGIISGKVTESGAYTFIVQVTDADSRTANKTFTITTSTNSPSTPLSITTTSLPTGEVNKLYPSTTLSATGGTIPRSWTLVGGIMPPGLSLASATGIISGTPTAGGSYDLIFRVTDMDLTSVERTLSIVVLDPTVSGGGSIQYYDGTSAINTWQFGNVYTGTLKKKTVTLKNTTSVSVTITGATSSNAGFTVPGAPFTIAANGSATLDISFVPATIKAYSGSITLTDSKGSNYQLAVIGTGVGTNVEIKSGTGTVSYFNMLSLSSLPTLNKPTDFVGYAAADFQITGVTAGSSVTVAVSFASIPENPVFYKIVDNNWILLTGASVSGNVVTFSITDNSEMDADKTSGVIRDPIVVGTNNGGSSSSTNVTPPSSGGGGGGCFIATAAFGSYLDPHVMVLRHFRDNVLLQSQLGTAFVKFYYRHSPPIADYIAKHDSLRMIMRLALTPLIFAVKYPLAIALLFVIAGFWFLLRRESFKSSSQQPGLA